MKRRMIILLFLLVLLSCSGTALASEFEVDPHGKMEGMELTWYQGYEPEISYHTMTIHLPLRAAACVGDITVAITLDDPNVFLLTKEPKAVTVSPKDGLYPVKLSLSLERHRRNGDYPATITITGSTESGERITETIPHIIRIRDGMDSHETMEPVISDVMGELAVGRDGTLNLTVSNPTTTQSITNGEITVTDPTGDIVMSGPDCVRVSEILPGRSEIVTIPVIVNGNASIRQHSLEVKFTYTVLNTEGERKETFTLPVTQEIRLEQGGLQLSTVLAGDLGTMSLPLMNMGKGELQNVLVKLEMDGVLDAQSVLVGTIAPGETKQGKMTFTPKMDSVGTHSGTVTITCEDAYGNGFSQILDVALTVEEPLPEEELLQEEEKERIPKSTVFLLILCGIMVIAFIVQGTILTKKIHKLEEERL